MIRPLRIIDSRLNITRLLPISIIVATPMVDKPPSGYGHAPCPQLRFGAEILFAGPSLALELPLGPRVAALHNDCHHDETNRACDEPNRA
jgi:hypothetical protein